MQRSIFPLKINKTSYNFTTIPKRIVKNLQIENSCLKITFKDIPTPYLTKAYLSGKSGQNSMYLRQELDKYENLEITNICKIHPHKRSNNLLFNEKIDMLALIPERTRKGFDMYVEEFNDAEEAWLAVWYYTGNSGVKQVNIKRYVDAYRLGALLGILQAEGTKFLNIKKTQSPSLVFANKSVQEHKEFVDNLLDLGISEHIKAKCHYNLQNVSSNEVKKYIDSYTNLTNITPTTYEYNSEKLYYTSWTVVERSALAEIILKSMDYIRILLTDKDNFNMLKPLSYAFVAKLLTGDGCISITKNSKNQTRVQGYISDKDKNYRDAYRKILRNFGLAVANWDDSQRVYFKCSRLSLQKLHTTGAFRGTRSEAKIKKGLLHKLKYEKFTRLKDLSIFDNFTTLDAKQIFGVKLAATKNWIRDKAKKGYICISKIDKHRHYYSLTDKAASLIKLIDSLN